MEKRIPVIIPAYEPDEKMIRLLQTLQEAGIERIVVVDDGSGNEYRNLFEQAKQLGAIVLTHAVNLGKGRALKTAFNEVLNRYPEAIGAITADSDGQHTPACIQKCMEAMEKEPEKLILGCRNLDQGNVPAKSEWGNKITRQVLKYLCGVAVSDTQTGLRGIPAAFMRHLMNVKGERAVMELGIHGLHPDLIKLIGRLKYRTSFGQNALTHSMEVAWVAGLLAGEMGVNVTMARRAGLLHDIGKALDHEIEGSHVQIGVDICRKYKENTQIIHAIEAHHGDVEPKTPLAFIIQAADAISAARPGARRENVESYVKRLENLEEISSSFEGVEQAFAVQAGREVRIMVKPDVISDDQVILLARSIAKKIEDTLDYPGQIKVNVIRESRAVEYAK